MPASASGRPRNKAVPPWALALKVRRIHLGKSQEQVALDSGILNQTTVSELEGGRYDIANLAAARLAGLARGLDWTLAELESTLEVDFGLTTYEETSSPQRKFSPSARGWKATKQRPPIPEALLEAGRLYGDNPLFKGITEYRWQRWLTDSPHKRRPQTPEEWLTVYMEQKDKFDPPEPEPEE